MHWLGIDVGTGGTRALLVDAEGRSKAAFTAPHEPMRMEEPLWAEQRPEDWWDATLKAVQGVLGKADVAGQDVAGIGLTGQMHGLVLLDADNRVIRPSLIWCDQRSQAQVESIHEVLGIENIVGWTANPSITGFTLPKLLWVRENEPESYSRTRKVLLPKDYVRFRLTGDYASDVSDASGTGIFDVVNRCWSEDVIDGLELDRSVLPEVVESDQTTGRISGSAAAQVGLLEGTPVVGGAGDQAASALGNGIVAPGIVSCTIGTSGVVFAHTADPTYDPAGRVHTFCHAAARAWHVMGVTQAAGLSLQWFRNNLAPGTGYESLIDEAASAPAGSKDLFWLPYLMGERTPHLDAAVRGGWAGLTASHTRAELIRSVLEGVSYSQKDGLDVIEALGIPVTSIRMSGGGARSPFWRQMLADLLGKPVAVLENEEGSAYGAALLALAGTGESGSVEEIAARTAREVASYTPKPEAHAVYREGHARYQALYPALEPFYHPRRNQGH